MRILVTVFALYSFVFLALAFPTRLSAQMQRAPETAARDNASHDNAPHEMSMPMDHTGMAMDQHHGASVPVTYAELTETAALLEKARQATEKYQDVRVALTDGYLATGPNVSGMGTHFVGTRGGAGFDIARPSILLYEKSSSGMNGFSLVGVSYLLTAPEGPDGQPVHPPFPNSLASWHHHENLCVLADRSVKGKLNQEQCAAQGGQFTKESQWMVHAWIWKDSPTGVFSPTNPMVQ